MARLQITFSDDLQKDLYDFACLDSTTPNEIVRRAMVLYAMARAENESGGDVILRTADGHERRIIAF